MNQSHVADRSEPTWKRPRSGQPALLDTGRSSDKWSATLIALLLVGLLGYLVWTYWPQGPGKIVWAVLPIAQRGTLGAQSDDVLSCAATLQQVFTGGGVANPDRLLDWSGLEISQAGALDQRIAAELAQADLRDPDTLVLYVAGSGFTRDGQARILFSDALIQDVAEGSFALTDLLTALEQCPAGTKLLILDIDVPAFDPRIGVLFNEFSHCAAQAIAAARPGLWVLISQRDFETPGEYASHPPSLLNALVVDALDGQATVNERGHLELRELYRFVARECHTLFADHPADGQHPVLLSSGQREAVDASHIADGHRLAMLTVDRPSDESAVEKAATRKARSQLRSGTNRVKSQLKSQLRQRTGLPQIFGGTVTEAPTTASSQAPSPAAAQEPTPTTPASPASDAPATGQADAKHAAQDDSAPPTDTPADAPTDTAAKPGDVKSAPERVPPPPAITEGGLGEVGPEIEMQQALTAMWTVWDALRADQRPFWAPLDVCPLAWRRLEWELLQRNREWRMWYDASDVAEKARDITHDLRQLDAFVRSPDAAPTFRSELATFLDSIAAAYTKNTLPSVDPLMDASYLQRDAAVRAYNKVFYYLPDLAHWHAHTSLAPELGAASPFDQAAGKLLGLIDDLSALRTALEQLDGQLLERPADLERLTDNVTRSYASLQAELQVDVERAMSWHDLAGEKQVACLLDSSLPSAPQRAKLLEHYVTRRSAAPQSATIDDADPRVAPETVVPAVQWKRITQLIAVQAAIVAQADGAAADQLTQLAGAIAAAEDDRGRREASRAVGAALCEFYAGLPERVSLHWRSRQSPAAGSSDSADNERDRRLRGLVRLVDARDVARRTSSEQYTINDEFAIRIKTRAPQLELESLADPIQIALQQDLAQEVRIPFRAVAISPAVTAMIESSPPHAVQVARREGEQTVACEDGVPFSIAVDPSAGEHHQLNLLVRALRPKESANEEPAHITVTLSTPEGAVRRSVACHVLCQMPQPERVELIVRKSGSTVPEPMEGPGIIRLRSFPNRATSYELYLTNLTEREKPVTVQLYRLAAVPRATWAPGRLRAHDDQLAQDVLRTVFADGVQERGISSQFAKTHLIAHAEVTLQANNLETPLMLVPGAPAQEQPKSDPEGTAQTPAASAEQPSDTDVSFGLLFWIVDQTDPTRTWAYWVETSVLPPREYVTLHPPTFHNGEIAIDAELTQSAGYSWNEQEPVRVAWTGIASIDLSDKTPRGSLKKGGLAADGQVERVWIAVDGYPRSFVLDVPRQPSTDDMTTAFWNGRFAGIRIERVTARFRPPSTDAQPPPADVRDINGPPTTIAFQPCETLTVNLAADVPDRTFAADYDPAQAIRLTVDGQLKAGPFYADRDVKNFLVDVGKVLTVRTTVSDYSVDLRPGGQDTSIELEASLPRLDPATDPARVTIQVDGQAPNIISQRRSVAVDQGQPATLQLDLDDTLSGIDRLLFGFAADANAIDESKLTVRPVAASPNRERVVVRLPTAAAKLEPGKTYAVALVAYDEAGNRAQDVLDLRVHAPAPPRPVGDIAGTVSFGGRALESGWTLQISGPGLSKPVKHGLQTKDMGFQAKGRQLSEFWFKGLKPGTYSITVEGYPTGKTVKSKPIEVSVEAGKESAAPAITEFD